MWKPHQPSSRVEEPFPRQVPEFFCWVQVGEEDDSGK